MRRETSKENAYAYDKNWFLMRRTELFNWMNRSDKTVHQCLNHATYTIEMYSKHLLHEEIEGAEGS
jgi:hypothetical protein